MKAFVDKELCIGCGLCASIAENVFELDGDVARVYNEPNEEDANAVKEAEESCPVSAISAEE